MKHKPKNKKLLIIMIAIAFIFTVFVTKSGIVNTRSVIKIGYIGQETQYIWSAKYKSLSGIMNKTFKPKNDKIHIDVTTKSGSISIEIKDIDKNVIFNEDNMKTSSYEIDSSEKITVHIKANKHKGSFSIE